MAEEILTKVQETMMLLESRKNEIVDLLKSRQFGKEVESKIEEISQIKFQKREGFQESVNKYLSLYGDYENSIFKEEIISIRKSVEESNEIFIGMNKIILIERENFEKKFDFLENKMNENINNINNSISKIQKEVKIISQKDEKNIIKILLEDAENRESKINQQINDNINIKNDIASKIQREMKNEIENKLIELTEDAKNRENNINEKMNQMKQELIDKFKMQEIEFTEKDNINITNDIANKIQREMKNEIENKFIKLTEDSKNLEEMKQEFIKKEKECSDKNKNSFETLEKKINDNMITTDDSISKIEKEMKNETKNIFLKLQVDCENKLNQAINQTKQDFAKQLKTQELQYYKNNINLYEEYWKITRKVDSLENKLKSLEDKNNDNIGIISDLEKKSIKIMGDGENKVNYEIVQIMQEFPKELKDSEIKVMSEIDQTKQEHVERLNIQEKQYDNVSNFGETITKINLEIEEPNHISVPSSNRWNPDNEEYKEISTRLSNELENARKWKCQQTEKINKVKQELEKIAQEKEQEYNENFQQFDNQLAEENSRFTRINEEVKTINDSISGIQIEELKNEVERRNIILRLPEKIEDWNIEMNRKISQNKTNFHEKIIQKKVLTKENLKKKFEKLEADLNENIIIENSISKLNEELLVSAHRPPHPELSNNFTQENNISLRLLIELRNATNSESIINQEIERIYQDFISILNAQQIEYVENSEKILQEISILNTQQIEYVENSKRMLNEESSILQTIIQTLEAGVIDYKTFVNNKIKELNEMSGYWSEDYRHYGMEYTNSNHTVTRTVLHGSSAVLWSRKYSTGIIEINFHIESGGSDKLFIGILNADNNYNWISTLEHDTIHYVWLWRKSGKFHKRGEDRSIPGANYTSGDDVALLINMNNRSISYKKNDAIVYTVEGISAEVIPFMFLGEVNQCVTASASRFINNNR